MLLTNQPQNPAKISIFIKNYKSHKNAKSKTAPFRFWRFTFPLPYPKIAF